MREGSKSSAHGGRLKGKKHRTCFSPSDVVPLYSIISRENNHCVQKAYRDDVDSTFLIRSDILSWVIAHYGAVLSRQQNSGNQCE